MATLKLKKGPPGTALPTKPRDAGRGPVRGIAAPRKQRTLAEAQAERAQRAQRDERPDRGERPARPQRPQRPHGPQGSAPGQRPARPERPDSSQRPARPTPEQRSPRPTRPQDPAAPARPTPTSPPPYPPRRPRKVAPDAAARVTRPLRPSSPASAEGERLSKRMTAMGLSSRREADDWIAAGWVRVDGKLAVLGQRIGPDARIDIDPRARNEQAQRVTVLLNKPVGYVSGQAEDGHEPAITLVTAANRWEEDRGLPFQAGHLWHLAPAGRLDLDSTGLLVLTQDGRIAKALVGEDARIEKEYLVRVQRNKPGPLSEAEFALLQHGLTLDDVPLKPAKVSWANEDQLRFVLREGKKRQIRRMCELVGLEVVGLKRVRIGSVVLGKLPAGQWRYLRSDESF